LVKKKIIFSPDKHVWISYFVRDGHRLSVISRGIVTRGGKDLDIGEAMVYIIDLARQTVVRKIRAMDLWEAEHEPVWISPPGQYVANAVGGWYLIRHWNRHKKDEVEFPSLGRMYREVGDRQLSGDPHKFIMSEPKRIISAAEDDGGAVIIFQIRDDKIHLLTYSDAHHDQIAALALDNSPECVLTAGVDGLIKIWSIQPHK
jgi:WD40 repeat protein